MAQLLTGDRSTFEAGIADWQCSGATLSQSTAQARTGTGSMLVTATTASDKDAGTGAAAADFIPVTVGVVHTLRAYTRAGVTARIALSQIIWYTAANGANFLSTSSGSGVFNTLVGWTLAEVVATAPASATHCRVSVYISSAAISDDFYIDDVTLSTPDAITYTHAVQIG